MTEVTPMTTRPINIRVIDFETSDLPAKNGKIIEIGWTDIDIIFTEEDEEGKGQPPYVQFRSTGSSSQRFGLPPYERISPHAKAVNGIWENELPYNVLTTSELFSFLQCEASTTRQFDYLVAHNSSFEEEMFSLYGIGKPDGIYPIPPFICTMKAAKRLFPEAGGYSLQYLRHVLALENNFRDPRCDPPHAAGPDTWLTAKLFIHMHDGLGMSTPILHSCTTSLQHHPVCPIGKYKGQAWNSVETSYLQWIINTSKMDESVKNAARLELNCRN